VTLIMLFGLFARQTFQLQTWQLDFCLQGFIWIRLHCKERRVIAVFSAIPVGFSTQTSTNFPNWQSFSSAQNPFASGLGHGDAVAEDHQPPVLPGQRCRCWVACKDIAGKLLVLLQLYGHGPYAHGQIVQPLTEPRLTFGARSNCQLATRRPVKKGSHNTRSTNRISGQKTAFYAGFGKSCPTHLTRSVVIAVRQSPTASVR